MTVISLKDYAAGGRLLGTREIALPIRDLVDAELQGEGSVVLDFGSTNPTQSFVDELVGVLVIEHGPEVLGRLVMRNCSEDTKAILHFVVGDRLQQREERSSAVH